MIYVEKTGFMYNVLLKLFAIIDKVVRVYV